MQQHIDFHVEISVIKCQAWPFDENSAFQNRFSKRSKQFCDKSLTFWVVASQNYHFVQFDLVSIGFIKA